MEGQGPALRRQAGGRSETPGVAAKHV